MTKPLAIDLFCGLGGWTEGLLSEDFQVIGFDIERHIYGDKRYPAQLVLQDVTTIHGSQFKDAQLIVASPPCQEYSYMAMPWSLAKQREREYLDGTRDVRDLTRLFDACFRIQREACEAAGRHIPMVVENVRGAQKWVGRAKWNFGSFYLWGDVPALMPNAKRGMRTFQSASVEGQKGIPHRTKGHWTNPAEHEAMKQPGLSGQRDNGKGDRWFQDDAASHGSKSSARKAASAQMAKIPLVLARHIAHVYKDSPYAP